MEIANEQGGGSGRLLVPKSADGVTVWQAEKDDFGLVQQLLKSAPWRHKHVDWFDKTSWLGEPHFVMSRSQDGANGCLAIVADPKPSAWLRLAALERPNFNRNRSFLQMGAMFDVVCDYLRSNGVTSIGWMAPIAWPDEWPEKLGFSVNEEIITYQKPTFKLPALPHVHNLEIRPGTAADAEVLEEIEERAFPPVWRHSAHGLICAMKKAFSFDVAVLAGEVVGFQHSATGRGSAAHLARITVDPALQGSGIGSHLLAHAVRGYQRRGAVDMTLNTESVNVSAQRLYERFGYIPNGYRFPLYMMDLTQ